MNKKNPSIIGITAASSGTGKTTLIEKLIPDLLQKNINVSVVKHAHHNFDIDYPGKDSYRLRKSGAFQTLIFNDKRSALITEFSKESENLEKMIAQMDQSVDLIIVEGLRGGEFKKIEVYRPAHSMKKLFLQDENVIAIVSDENFDTSVPCLNLNNIEEISNFIISNL
jgi:molybdopterin-guanine dinucleotide biosynthesis protein MobB